jgi:outer membrane protein assembly factor BamB
MVSAHFSRRFILASGACTLGAGCLGVGAERTPPGAETDWRMYGRDPGRSRFVPNAELPRDGVDVAWEHDVGAHGWLPPVVADGTVYCQYSNGLFVLDAETGEGTNVATHGGFGRNAVPMAFGSTTAYRNGALVVSYGNAVAGYAADSDGWPEEVSGIGRNRARWWADGDRTDTDPPANYAADLRWLASPVVAEGRLVSVHDSGVVSAVDPDNGSAEWRRPLDDVGPDPEHTPVPIGHVVDLETGAVVVKCRLVGRPLLVGLDLETGETEWTLSDDTDADYDGSLLATDGSVYTIDGPGYREYRLLAVDAAAETRHEESLTSIVRIDSADHAFGRSRSPR